MAITNSDRVGKALDLLREGLKPFVARELESRYGKYWVTEVTAGGTPGNADIPVGKNRPEGIAEPNLDIALLLRILWDQWNAVFTRTLGHSERSIVSELRETRNKWAHQNNFSSDDTYRALDSAARLLTAISAPQADEVEKIKMELLRLRFDEQIRNEKRKGASSAIESPLGGNLKPWREVVTPHKDVASGRYQQAEFAADLWQVYLGQGSDEYRDPVEFFRRTYLTESLKTMLVGAVRRLTGQGGDPVVQLQTNFGGGKTHSMLALYHLFSGIAPSELVGVDAVLAGAGNAPGNADILSAPLPTGMSAFPGVRRVVLVGNKISPGNPVTKLDGTVVRTLWGELAWQLGGKPAYARIRADDERATNPGDLLRELFNEYGPCLILIDEWVAYARQLHDQSDLPAGGFETQFTFAQALTESARLAKNCLLVISLPASDGVGTAQNQVHNVEVGGERGHEALNRLQNVVGRLESSWRPASAEEGFEIVRRRLFEPLSDPAQFKDRDVVARTFADFYRTQHQEFPPECRDADYEKRIRSAYPIHPEIFDRLYSDWSTLIKFQRTRGVLRLMAAVIHNLWEKGDRNPLIMPANIAIDDSRVQFELTRYLSDNWVPVIEKDVDGANSLPLHVDSEVPNLGKYAACRRVARTIYLGSAPTVAAAHRGLEDRQVKLGCVLPGESPAIFGDALRRLASKATYLYQDGARYWYSTQPTVTKLAEDRAEQLRREPDTISEELRLRINKDLATKGDFSRVHSLPHSGHDVVDILDARLVVLGIEHPYSKEASNAAELAAKAILETHGNTPRLYRNTLVFLAADKTRLQDLDEATRKYLAWASIVAEKEQLDLTPLQVRQAETQLFSANGAVTARLPETYQWLLVPTQETPQSPLIWQAFRLTGQDALAVRASKKLKNDDLLVTTLAGTMLRMWMDKIPLWRGDHVAIRQLVEDFARYHYLPRLKNPAVLLDAVSTGVGSISWELDSFAYAESFDANSNRYRSLQTGIRISLWDADAPGVLVKPSVAQRQLNAEQSVPSQTVPPIVEQTDAAPPQNGIGETKPSWANSTPTTPQTTTVAPAKPPVTRYHGAVTLDTTRVGRDASRIAEEVIAHLSGLVGANVTVTLEIEAHLPNGAPDQVVRTVTENSRTLKFTSQGFEAE